VSKSDIWLFCVLLGNAIPVISRNALLPGPAGDENTLDRKREITRNRAE
jgi:hypothetical protein